MDATIGDRLRDRGQWVVLVAALVASAVLVWWLLSPSPARPARPVLVASGSWDPFVGPDLPDDGPVALIVAETLRLQGYEPELSFSSWPVVLERTRRGEVLGGFPFIASDERREDFLLSDPVLDFEYVLFYSKLTSPSPPDIDDPGSFETLRVGLIDGYEVWPELDEAVDDFVVYPTSLDAFEALAAGEIDLLPEGRLSGEAVLASGDLTSDIDDFGVVEAGADPLLGATEQLYLLAPRTDEAADFLDSFNASLGEVKQTDLYRSILDPLAEGRHTEVELVPAGGANLVELWNEPDGTNRWVAPPGTRALVLSWPADFTNEAPSGATTPRVQVKVLNGPAAGRVAYVEAAAIRLTPGDN